LTDQRSHISFCRRRLLGGALAAGAAALLAACAPAAPTAAPTGKPAEAKPADASKPAPPAAAPKPAAGAVTLRVQPQTDWMAQNANAEALAYRKAHEQFLKDNPNVKVELEIIPAFDRYKQFTVADEGGNPPDITFQGAANTFTIASAGRVRPLNEYMEGHPYLNPQNLKSAILETETIAGKYYGIPTTTDARLLYYRKDLFKEAGLDPAKPPTTREELVEHARKLTKGGDKWGYGFVADNSLHTAHMWLTHVWAAGGELLDPDGKAVYDSAAGQSAAKLYADLVAGLKVSPPQVISTDYDASVRALVGGQYAIALLGSWSWPTDLHGALGDEKIGWTKIPPPQQGGREATFGGGWSWMISAKSKTPKEAWDYIAATNNEEVALMLGKQNISCRQSVLNNPELKGTFVAEVGQYAAAAARGNPKVVATQALFDGIRQALQDAIQGKAQPDQAIKAAAVAYNDKYYKK
jgi:multiple sugar transport system substrate-binding protein